MLTSEFYIAKGLLTCLNDLDVQNSHCDRYRGVVVIWLKGQNGTEAL